MPVHDWSRVEPGVFHDFHNVWIALLRIALNSGLLPEGFYAMTEQHGGKYIADVLTLHERDGNDVPARAIAGGVDLADTPRRVHHHTTVEPAAKTRQKTLTIRRVSGHRIIALLEIVSPANKDCKKHVDEFLCKLEDALQHGIHVVLVELFAPGKYHPRGLHAALLKRLGGRAIAPPKDKPLTLASFVAAESITVNWRHLDHGMELPDMPLFLDSEVYVQVPLEKTYQTVWESAPPPWRGIGSGVTHCFPHSGP